MESESKSRLLKGHEVAQILNISRALAYRMMQRGDIVVDPFNWTQKKGLKGSVLSQI